MSVLCVVVFGSLMGTALSAVSEESCTSMNSGLPLPLFMLQDGMISVQLSIHFDFIKVVVPQGTDILRNISIYI